MTNVLQRDMEKIRMAIDQTDGAEFERVVDTIIGARRIYIVGFRSSSFLAGYLNFYFRLIFDNVTLVNGGAAGSFDQLFRFSSSRCALRSSRCALIFSCHAVNFLSSLSSGHSISGTGTMTTLQLSQ